MTPPGEQAAQLLKTCLSLDALDGRDFELCTKLSAEKIVFELDWEEETTSSSEGQTMPHRMCTCMQALKQAHVPWHIMVNHAVRCPVLVWPRVPRDQGATTPEQIPTGAQAQITRKRCGGTNKALCACRMQKGKATTCVMPSISL